MGRRRMLVEMERRSNRNRNDQGLTTAEIEKYSRKNKYSYFANENGDAKCVICLRRLRANQQVRQLRWEMHFHVSCIDRWLKSIIRGYSNRGCPTCRRRI